MKNIAAKVIPFKNEKVITYTKDSKEYKDYDEQMKKGIDPYYDPDKLSWKGVDVEMWKDINKKRIEENKNK